MSKRNGYVGAAIVVAAVVVAHAIVNAPERRVRRRLFAMAETVTLASETDDITKALKLDKLRGFIASELTLDTPVPQLNGTLSRPAVLDLYKAVLAYADCAMLEFSGIEFTKGEKGTCPFEVDVTGWIQVGEHTRRETFRANAMALKTDRGWRFSAFERTAPRSGAGTQQRPGEQ